MRKILGWLKWLWLGSPITARLSGHEWHCPTCNVPMRRYAGTLIMAGNANPYWENDCPPGIRCPKCGQGNVMHPGPLPQVETWEIR